MSKKLLDLGCGVNKRKDAIGVDIIPNEHVDIVHDLNTYPYPFKESEIDDILMDNFLEHLDDIVKTMEELWRICKPGAKITIRVPYFRSHFAVDPTHKHYFVSHSFYYFDPCHDFHRRYRYSDKAFFRVDRVVFDEECNYSLIGLIRFGPIKWFANRYPMVYEEYLGPLFPLHSLTYYLKTIK
ncbi:methyltransferase domain-containing protein [bacterium]|nr:methyltransferase domain-containing protein [bacterium]